jgi:hypothetical protein
MNQTRHRGGSIWGLAAAPQNSSKLLSQWQPGIPTTIPITLNRPSAQRLRAFSRGLYCNLRDADIKFDFERLYQAVCIRSYRFIKYILFFRECSFV